MWSKIWLAVLMPCLLGYGTAMLAESAKIGGTVIELVPPPAFCALDEARSVDQTILGVVRAALGSTNRLLGMSADCGQIDSLRNGKRQFLDDYAQYQTLTASMDTPIPDSPAEAIKSICQVLRTEGDRIVGQVGPEVKARAELALKNAKVHSMSMIGVLAEEAEVCYFGAIIDMTAQSGAKRVQLSVGAVTAASGKLVYYYLFAPYAKLDDFNVALERHKRNVAAFRSQNRP